MCLVWLRRAIRRPLGQVASMRNAIHLINRRKGPTLLGLDRWVEQADGFRSCCWQLSDEQAASLVGGWVYLHGSKAERSSFGGQILGFEQGQDGSADRKAILFRAEASCRGQRWRGANHGMAYTSGIVTADLPHEH